MEPLQLSSICRVGLGWFFGAAFTPALIAARANPHWVEICKPGHFDLPCDDCMEMAKFTAEEYAAWLATSPGTREFLRRVVTSRNPLAVVRRLRARV